MAQPTRLAGAGTLSDVTAIAGQLEASVKPMNQNPLTVMIMVKGKIQNSKGHLYNFLSGLHLFRILI